MITTLVILALSALFFREREDTLGPRRTLRTRTPHDL